MIKLPIFMKKNVYNAGNNFVLVYELGVLFQNINEEINCLYKFSFIISNFIISFSSSCTVHPQNPPTIYRLELVTLVNQCLVLLRFLPIWNNIFRVIVNADIFMALILKLSLGNTNISDPIKKVCVLDSIFEV